jgi:hypothetical protein
MILRGLMDQSLGGFVCIRGYAPLGDLARVSHANLDYQRELIKTHRETVIRFLRNRKSLFFPELILSCPLSYDFNKPRAISGLKPLLDVLEGRGFKSNTNGIAVAIRRVPFKGMADTRAMNALQVASLTLPDGLLKTTPLPLFRIDGNHRLSAADQESDFKEIVAPFCIILFNSGHDDERNSKTIFHNINSKTIPLTSEENLRIILDSPEVFTDEALQEPTSFGLPYLLARRAMPSIQLAAVPALANVLKHPRTALVDLFTLLIEKKAIPRSDSTLPDVVACFKQVDAIYAVDDELRTKHGLGLFQAFVYFCLTDRDARLLKPFKQWVSGNHLAALTQTDAHALIGIFESLHTAKARTIFVSMQFGETTDDTYDAIVRTVEAINAQARPKIKIKPLRIDKLNKGHSYTITDAILTAIEDSGLLIADLTHANPNVYHEVGYMMGLNRGRGLKQENFILVAREESGSSLDKTVGFNLRGVSQIRFKRFGDLEQALAARIRAYYGLGDE